MRRRSAISDKLAAAVPSAIVLRVAIVQSRHQRHHARSHHHRHKDKAHKKIMHRNPLESTDSADPSRTRPTFSLSAIPCLRITRFRTTAEQSACVEPCSPRKNRHSDAKRPPGNRAAFSLGRIVPTEAKPSELSACILVLAQTGVKAKTLPSQHA